jgi:Family of unknown function (DUF6308)
VLRSGVEIADTLETALDFVARDGSYRAYDLAPVAVDADLTEADVRVANGIIARMPGRVVERIVRRAPAVNAALERIPAETTLLAPEEDVPWEALELLLLALAGLDEVGLPRATKVLHKKRPALVPILDSVVETYLRSVEEIPRLGDFAADGVALIRSYKRELDATGTGLRALRGELAARGIELTECRLLDLFLWAYSGTCTPLWQRAGAATAATADGRPVPALPSSATAVLATPIDGELVVFRDDEAGYLAWLEAHPHGFVLNAARSPRPDYLILHRASCRTISGQPTRGDVWTGPYIKVCADGEAAIERWTAATVGAAPRRCLVCA